MAFWVVGWGVGFSGLAFSDSGSSSDEDLLMSESPASESEDNSRHLGVWPSCCSSVVDDVEVVERRRRFMDAEVLHHHVGVLVEEIRQDQC